MKKHEYYEMLISREKDSDLNEEEITELKEHIKNCKLCGDFQRRVNTVSDIMKGNFYGKINMEQKPAMIRLRPYLISLAAILIFAFSVFFVWQNSAGFIDPKDIVASSETDNVSFEKDYNEDYFPLSGYFNYTEENEDTNDTIIIMSAYMQYMGN